MTIKARREREKRDLRRAILNAARELAASEGWGAVSIRKIAERVEYSPPILYEFFDSKERLLVALMVEGYEQLVVRLNEARATAHDPYEALLAMTMAYFTFAQDSPELYQVMNGLDGVYFCDLSEETTLHAMTAVRQLVMEAVAAWGTWRNLRFTDLETKLYLLWGTLHGLTALIMAGRVTTEAGTPPDLVKGAMQNLLRGWEAGEGTLSTT
jgi:AcrR family transcriptional regulator